MKKPITTLVVMFLVLVALLHLLRMVLQIEITAAGVIVPQWASLFGCLIPGGLAFMLRAESKR